uniref:Ribonuclease A-domain domain-containing protein n=1 Tax=Salvator merianae TaxID=96440 RepID=A0A8D0BQB9_SALMN
MLPSYRLFSLLTILLGLLLVQSCEGQRFCETAYQKFLRQHYDNPKSNVGRNYCNAMMQRRELTKPTCKDVNSFIHEKKQDILDVCTDKGGKAYKDGLRVSLKPFSVTTCKHKGGSTRPPCEYKENKSERYIVIRCNNRNEPVHFDESIIVPEVTSS